MTAGATTGAGRACDLAQCHDAIRTGSYSFHAASRLLPRPVRDRAIVLYAFCRLADDAVDETPDKAPALAQLAARLDAAYAGRPRDHAVDRAFARLIDEVAMPRALPEALIEGLAWDVRNRRYDDLSGVLEYAARVAAAVGAMMCVLMDVRDPHRLARACDLGLAMQLTNIARDVGEDARAGRVFLPLDWLDAAGLRVEDLSAMTHAPPALSGLVAQLLDVARAFYQRAEPGIAALPLSVRPSIMAARLVYDGIGHALARQGHDSIGTRARTTAGEKIGLLGLAGLRTTLSAVMPCPATLYAPPAPQTAFLVRAASVQPHARDASDTMFDILATLRRHDMAMRGRMG